MEKNQSYIVGVSGGSDSMVLLHLLNLFKFNIVVAHVNYKKRESADVDQQLVEAYCKKMGIPYEIYIVDEIPRGNFQAQARKIRYQFFRDLVKKHHASGVVIAHHLDDLFETYLIQKQSKRIPLYWGLKEMVEIEGLVVYRPLLDFSKKDILEYARIKKLMYGEDETNALLVYKRNQIRHEKVSLLTDSERNSLLLEIDEKNQELKKMMHEVNKVLKREFQKDYYLAFPLEIRLEALRQWLLTQGVDSRHFSLAHLKELDQLLGKERNIQYVFHDKVLYLDYGVLSITNLNVEYCYEFKEIKEMDTLYFKVRKTGDAMSAISVSKDDFPLTIRNWKDGDKIELRYGHKKVSRFLIERKIPIKERRSWPVVVNRNEEIIFVLGIGCDVKHYSNIPNMFVVK